MIHAVRIFSSWKQTFILLAHPLFAPAIFPAPSYDFERSNELTVLIICSDNASPVTVHIWHTQQIFPQVHHLQDILSPIPTVLCLIHQTRRQLEFQKKVIVILMFHSFDDFTLQI